MLEIDRTGEIVRETTCACTKTSTMAPGAAIERGKPWRKGQAEPWTCGKTMEALKTLGDWARYNGTTS